MRGLLFSLVVFSLLVAQTSAGSCPGICQNVNTSCPSPYERNLCPGDASVACCPMPTPSCSGQCQITKVPCSGNWVKGACPGPTTVECCEPSPPAACQAPLLPLNSTSTFLFTIQHQMFPGHPGGLVHVPDTFNKSQNNFQLVLYIHGFYNCIENAVRAPTFPDGSTCNCSDGGPLRQGYGIIDQFDKVTSRVADNVLLVVAEVAFDEASSAVGAWAEQGAFINFVDEVLVNMAPHIGHRSHQDVTRLSLYSHSGGYEVVGLVSRSGGLNVPMHMVLLDSLYGDFSDFDSFILNHRGHLGETSAEFRFTSVYTPHGGTDQNNIAMAHRMVKALTGTSDEKQVYFDDTTAAVNTTALATHAVFFKRSPLAHNDVPRDLFGVILAAQHPQ